MRPLRLRATNFRSYADLDLDLSGIEMAAIVGPNGSGKSSLVHAMAFALYGRTGESIDDAVRVGAERCEVSLEYAHAGGTYQVTRQRQLGKRARSDLQIRRLLPSGEWEPMCGPNVADNQAEIERVLGMSCDVWLSTSYMEQDQFSRLLDAAPGDRIRLVSEILRLDVWERRAKVASERHRDLVNECRSLSTRAADITERLKGEEAARERVQRAEATKANAEADAARLDEELSAARSELEGARSAVVTLNADAERLRDLQARRKADGARTEKDLAQTQHDLATAERTITTLEAELAQLQADVADATALEGKAFLLRTEASAFEHDMEAARSDAASFREQAAEAATLARGAEEALPKARALRAQVAGMGAVCNECGQPVTEEHRAERIDALDAEVRRLEDTADEHRRRAREVGAKLQGAEERAGELAEKARKARDEEQAVERALERSRSIGERIPGHVHRIGEARSHAEDLVARTNELASALTVLQAPSEDEQMLAKRLDGLAELERAVSRASAAVSAAESGLRTAQRSLTDAASELARAQEALRRYEADRAELAQVESEQAIAAVAAEDAQILARSFGRDGVPALKVEGAIPAVQDHANRVLRRLMGGRLSVRLDKLKANRDGTLRETLDIHVSDGVSERLIKTFSGAERHAVALALAVGFAMLLAHRAGAAIETLIIDEGFTSFDEENLQHAVEIVASLRSDFPVILAITHAQAIAERMPAQIRVRREDGLSVAEVVAA